jgi:hypothetical protein
LFILFVKEDILEPDMVIHVCKSNYSESRGRRTTSLRPVPAKVVKQNKTKELWVWLRA